MQYDYCAAYLDLFSDEPQQAPADRRQVRRPPGRPLAERVRGDRRPSSTRSKGKDAQGRRRRRPQPAAGASWPRPSRASSSPSTPSRSSSTWQNLEDGAGQLLPDGRRAALQPQPVRAAVRRAVRVDPAERARRRSKLPADADASTTIPLPDELREQQRAGRDRRRRARRSRRPYYANALAVQLTENYGQVQVTRRGRAASRCRRCT